MAYRWWNQTSWARLWLCHLSDVQPWAGHSLLCASIPFSLKCGVGSGHSISMVEIKSRDIALPTKVSIVKAMVFPVVMYECESRTIKKAEHQRIDALELWCWRRLLRVPLTARRSNQSILKEIHAEYSLEGLMLEPKLHYFGHLM